MSVPWAQVRAITGTEWRLLTREALAVFAIGALLSLAAMSSVTGLEATEQQWRTLTETSSADAQARQRLEARVLAHRTAIGPLFEADGAVWGASYPSQIQGELATFRAVLPPAVTMPLAAGVSRALPQSYTYRPDENSTHSPPVPAGDTAIAALYSERPLGHMSFAPGADLDLAHVIVYFLPLVIVSLAYGVLADDRASGVLALTCAQPISPRLLVIARCAMRGGLVVVPVVMVMNVLLFVSANRVPAGRVVVPALMASAACVLYGIIWLAAAVIVNRGRTSAAANLLALVGAWLVWLLLVPTVAARIADVVYPVAAEAAVEAAIRPIGGEGYETANGFYGDLQRSLRVQVGLGPEAPLNDAYWRGWVRPSTVISEHPWLHDWRQTHPEWPLVLAPSQAAFIVGQRRLASHEERTAELLKPSANVQRRRRELVSALRYLSPGALVDDVLTILAGTDGARHERFLADIASYVRFQREVFAAVMARNLNLTEKDVEGLPRFAPTSARLVEPQSALPPLAGLAAWSLALVVFALWSRAMRRDSPSGIEVIKA
jgi:hypothetical protein